MFNENEGIFNLPIPGVQCYVNKDRVMALLVNQHIPGGAFKDQNYDGKGSDALWTQAGLTITTEGKQTFYGAMSGFVINEPIESYFKVLAQKMGY